MTEPNDETFLDWLLGRWSGPCRTWFEPDQLADESGLTGQFEQVVGGGFIRHRYQGQMKGKPRIGEELIAKNGVTGTYQVAWVDSFHMNYAIMFSQGEQIDDGFEVFGTYDVEKGTPAWGWKTRYRKLGPHELEIVAYNVSPEGEEAKAVEIIYRRD